MARAGGQGAGARLPAVTRLRDRTFVKPALNLVPDPAPKLTDTRTAIASARRPPECGRSLAKVTGGQHKPEGPSHLQHRECVRAVTGPRVALAAGSDYWG